MKLPLSAPLSAPPTRPRDQDALVALERDISRAFAALRGGRHAKAEMILQGCLTLLWGLRNPAPAPPPESE